MAAGDIGAREVLEPQRCHLGPPVEGLELRDVDVEVESSGCDGERLGHERKRAAHGFALGVGAGVFDQVVDRPVAQPSGGDTIGEPQVRAMLVWVRLEDRVVCALRLSKPSSAHVGAGVGQECLRPSIHANYDTTITPAYAPRIIKYYPYGHVGLGVYAPRQSARTTCATPALNLEASASMNEAMSAALEALPPAYLDAPREMQLRDVADLHVRIANEIAAGSSAIRIVGVDSLSYGSQVALDGLARRLAAHGVVLEIGRR